MKLDLKDLKLVDQKLCEYKYLRDDGELLYKRLGENLLTRYNDMEYELIETKTCGNKITFTYPFITEYLASARANSSLYFKIVCCNPFYEELMFFRAKPDDERSRTLIELMMMHDDIIMDQVTLYKVLSIALKMPGTKFYNYLVSNSIEKYTNNYEVYKKDGASYKLLLPCEVGMNFATDLLCMYSYGTNLERSDYKDLRFILLRHQYSKILKMTSPYNNAMSKLLYDLYDDQDTYDVFIDDFFMDISLRLEKYGIEAEFLDDFTDNKINEILDVLCAHDDAIELSGDIRLFMKLLRIRPYCFGGNSSYSN